MAFVSRVLSRARQVYSAQALFRGQAAIAVRSFSAGAAPPVGGSPPKDDPYQMPGDDFLKEIFVEVKNKHQLARDIIKKEKLILDPEDPEAVAHYAKVFRMVREKVGTRSVLDELIAKETHGITDARSYVEAVRDMFAKRGFTDKKGMYPAMLEAVTKLEKKIGTPLLLSDRKNMAIVEAEYDKIKKKCGDEELAKFEHDVEFQCARADLVDIKKEVVDAMEALLKRDEFKGEVMPDVRTLDVTRFL